MKDYFEIVDVMAREILDVSGSPALEAEVTLDDGTVGRASVASADTELSGKITELRDADGRRYHGRGVTLAVENVNGELAEALVGLNAAEQCSIDRMLKEIDGTPDLSRLGANALLGVSLACAKATAQAAGMSLYSYLGGVNAVTLPVPVMTMLTGTPIGELAVAPVGAENFREAVRTGFEIAACLEDEADTGSDSMQRDLNRLTDAIESAGYVPGEDVKIAVNAGAGQWYHPSSRRYVLPGSGESFTREAMLELWQSVVDDSPILSLTDPLHPDDWEGWQQLTAFFGRSVEIFGDGLFHSEPERIGQGIRRRAANGAVLRLNQIGTLTHALECFRLTERAGWNTLLCSTAGDTEETILADLAVAAHCPYIRFGVPGPAGGMAALNQLLRIEEELFDAARYGQ